MLDWFTETGFGYLLSVTITTLFGLLLVYRGLWGDHSKGRVRCPKCWYDMRGTLPKLECPECGQDAKKEHRLYRTRRRWRRIAIGVLLVFVFSYPLIIVGGWWREQSITRTLSKRGHRVGPTIQIGPDWVDRLPWSFARLYHRVEQVVLETSATDEDLAACGKLWHLHELWIGDPIITIFNRAGVVQPTGMLVTDAGLAHLGGLSRLRYLDLSATLVTDAGLARLKGLSQLQDLDLHNTKITDAGLVHLKGLAKLEILDLSGTQVTDVGARELRQTLPNTDITY